VVVTVPAELDPGHVYHLFPVLASSRDQLQVDLRSRGVETLVHYPIPIPRQQALAAYASGSCPVAEQVTLEVLSLPLYPSLPDEAVDTVADALRAATPR
jgi:dTDP-4-amino-4,6-dideoxygalactose transaminase